jgi:hypothetical protein
MIVLDLLSFTNIPIPIRNTIGDRTDPSIKPSIPLPNPSPETDSIPINEIKKRNEIVLFIVNNKNKKFNYEFLF